MGRSKHHLLQRERELKRVYLLREVQRGTSLTLPHSRPMPGIGSRCHELRIVDEGKTWRIISARTGMPSSSLRFLPRKLRRRRKQFWMPANDDCGSMTMRKAKKDRLEKKGWKVGNVQEFLQLSDDEAAYVELRLRLASTLRKGRQRRRLSQSELARRIKSSQSRVAKMEGGDPSVSLDLLIRSLLALGLSNRDLARAITAAPLKKAS